MKRPDLLVLIVHVNLVQMIALSMVIVSDLCVFVKWDGPVLIVVRRHVQETAPVVEGKFIIPSTVTWLFHIFVNFSCVSCQVEAFFCVVVGIFFKLFFIESCFFYNYDLNSTKQKK